MSHRTLRIGLFGIGLQAYWTQFAGLRQRLEGYLGQVTAQLERPGVACLSAGLVDTPEKAAAAGHYFRREDVDLIVLYVTTYALSSLVLPVVRRAGVPVLVLNLAPAAAIDYAAFNAMGDRTRMTGEWLAFCAACPVPEIANVFQRAGIGFHQVTGVLDPADPCWREVDEWLAAAGMIAHMADNRLGLMGHYYGGMLDIYSDVTLHSVVFGTHVEMLEVDELTGLRREVTAQEADARVKELLAEFDVQPDCPRDDLFDAARTSLALERLAAGRNLGSLAYYYQGTGVAENEATMASLIVGTSRLTGRGVPVAGEYEVKNAHAMKMMDLLGAGGSFTEYYAMDFSADVVLMGHDGPAHVAIGQGKTKVRPLNVYHGKVGRGLAVEMSVRHGPVTLLSVVERPGGKLGLVVAEGESVAGPILEIGNTNSRYRFAGGCRTFVERWNEQGPAHHCAVGVGHLAATLRKAAALWEIDFARVC